LVNVIADDNEDNTKSPASSGSAKRVSTRNSINLKGDIEFSDEDSAL